MFGSDIIDTAVGLFLVYFLFSLLCSALNEWVVGHMAGLRAKTLEIGVQRLLGDKAAAGLLFEQPLIQSLTQKDDHKPSYLSSSVFADALFALVGTKAKATNVVADPTVLETIAKDLTNLHVALDAIPHEAMQPILKSLIAGANDTTEARQKIEKWFDEGMDRASGWYKKKTRIFMFCWAVAVALYFYVDTFTIARELTNNSKLRASLVAAAEETVKQTSVANVTASTNQLQQIEDKIKGFQLPIGRPDIKETTNASVGCCLSAVLPLRVGEDYLSKISGLLVTAFALSFGAPFWFDLLSKVSNLRAAGKKPAAPKR